jgi:hypothetical protein
LNQPHKKGPEVSGPLVVDGNRAARKGGAVIRKVL